MSIIELSILLFAGALFCISLAAVLYVAYKFLAVVTTLDMAILRIQANARPQPFIPTAENEAAVLSTHLKMAMSGKIPTTEGEFIASSDEELFVQEELEKLKSLDDKNNYLESVLKKTKAEKLKKDIQKLLDETSKHLKHEAELAKEAPLEEKIESVREVPSASAGEILPAIKYVPRREQVSPLEKEVGGSQTANVATAGPGIKYVPPSASYEHQRIVESLRFYFSEQQQLVNKFTPETWQTMPEERKKQVFDVVKESLGISEVGSSDYTRVIDYISNVFSAGKKPEEKYKTRV
jgi:hypothetical protein